MSKNQFHYLTLDDRQQIQVMLEQGVSREQIARTLGRWSSVIAREIKKNGGVRQYCALSAHNRHLERCPKLAEKEQTSKKSMAYQNVDSSNIEQLNEEIENLKFQIEIILDQINEFREIIYEKSSS